jgi:hypothetical protein
MNSRPGSNRSVPRPAALALLLSFLLVPAGRAQTVVQVPPIGETPPVVSPFEGDSVSVWAAQAKAGFQSNLGDSASGENYGPYKKVGLIGRRLLRALGKKGLPQAQVVKPALDSLGFVTEVATDPASPAFVLLMVRNPVRFTADAVGFLYWYREGDLRLQGVVFQGGYHPRMRVWRTSSPGFPYECGILGETHARLLRFTLLRLDPGGMSWGIQQDERSLRVLGEPGEAGWLDLNQDGRPEFVSWTNSATDSLFTECPNCPKLITERTFVEDAEGFDLQDERLMPTPYAAVVYFVRLLIDGKLAQAEKLVRDPAMVREAVALGWNKRVVRKPWYAERRPDGEPWPSRLALRFEGPQGVKRYVVVFAKREGHWIIDGWSEPRTEPQRYPSVTMPPDTSATPATPAVRTRPPAAKPPAKRSATPAKSPARPPATPR